MLSSYYKLPLNLPLRLTLLAVAHFLTNNVRVPLEGLHWGEVFVHLLGFTASSWPFPHLLGSDLVIWKLKIPNFSLMSTPLKFFIEQSTLPNFHESPSFPAMIHSVIIDSLSGLIVVYSLWQWWSTSVWSQWKQCDQCLYSWRRTQCYSQMSRVVCEGNHS